MSNSVQSRWVSLTCQDGQPPLGREVPLTRCVQQIHLISFSSDVEQLPVEVLCCGLVVLFKVVPQEPPQDVGFAHFGSTEHHHSVTVPGLGQSQLQQVHGPLREPIRGQLPVPRARGSSGSRSLLVLPPALPHRLDDAHACLGYAWDFGVLCGRRERCALESWVRNAWLPGERVEHVQDAINGKVELLSCVHLRVLSETPRGDQRSYQPSCFSMCAPNQSRARSLIHPRRLRHRLLESHQKRTLLL